MQPKNLHFRVRDVSSRLQRYISLPFRPRGCTEHRLGDTLSRGFDKSEMLPLELDLSSMSNPGTPPNSLVSCVRHLEEFLPDGCQLLGPDDLKITGSVPVDAGGLADVWIGEKNGTTVAIKSFRYYVSQSPLPVYLRLYREASTYSYAKNGGNSLVSLIGVYSTLEHPLALVFEFMHHRNVREYLKDNRDVRRLKLALEIARGLSYLHSRGLVHGNLTIDNILVDDDGGARIAGLGTAHVPFSVPIEDIIPSSHGALAPELVGTWRWGLTDSRPTTASDVFALSLVIWEIFDGKPPFSDRSVAAGVYSILNGCRPGRPDHPEFNNRMWKMLRRCWKSNPRKRMKLSKVIAVLESELKFR